MMLILSYQAVKCLLFFELVLEVLWAVVNGGGLAPQK